MEGDFAGPAASDQASYDGLTENTSDDAGSVGDEPALAGILAQHPLPAFRQPSAPNCRYVQETLQSPVGRAGAAVSGQQPFSCLKPGRYVLSRTSINATACLFHVAATAHKREARWDPCRERHVCWRAEQCLREALHRRRHQHPIALFASLTSAYFLA
ncbi:hypothetical protein BCR34DRAFT_583879 [Clohesyomyces aquaticus]|uniref:Uncharacterized protein n=1 Tax=Clohesyomyces aquaticus TaxID=1231657 RepID=A0A1Y2A3S3_9PLEO|nr:hypothetical protein BCR34DRAFT_583879 [Clohesyomyces aquaticus]